MKAKNYLSKGTRQHLEGIDLRKHTVEFRNTLRNIEEDISYFVRNLSLPRGAHPVLEVAASMANILALNGSRYVGNFRKKYVEAYNAFLEANKEDLSKLLACAVYGLPVAALQVDPGDAYSISTAMRKLTQLAWLKSSWKGNSFPSMKAFLKEAEVPLRKEEVKTFSTVHNEWLEILRVGKGKLILADNECPAFPAGRMALYMVAQATTGAKHIICFPSLKLAKGYDQLNWKLERVCQIKHYPEYLLTGLKGDQLMEEVWGTAPFYMPYLTRNQ